MLLFGHRILIQSTISVQLTESRFIMFTIHTIQLHAFVQTLANSMTNKSGSTIATWLEHLVIVDLGFKPWSCQAAASSAISSSII